MLSIHLLDGYEFPDTLFYMTDKTATFVCSEKKVRLIQACKDKKPKGDTDDWTLDLVARGKHADEWQTIARSAFVCAPVRPGALTFVTTTRLCRQAQG